MNAVEYKGYTVVIDEEKLRYIIKQLISAPGLRPKYKIRRSVNGWGRINKDQFGIERVHKFRDLAHLEQHYKNFIDNHITTWNPTDRSKERKRG